MPLAPPRDKGLARTLEPAGRLAGQFLAVRLLYGLVAPE
jgi:hypothetical protein